MFRKQVAWVGLVVALGCWAPGLAAQAWQVRPVVVAGERPQVLVTRLDLEDGRADSTLLPATVARGDGASGAWGDPLQKPDPGQVFRSTWVDVAGLPHALASEELPHEGAEAHALRHAAALDVLLAEFPAQSVAEAAPPPLGEAGLQVLETSWTDHKGLKQHVQTARKSGETAEKWAQRHADGVSALMALYPPAAGGSGVFGCAAWPAGPAWRPSARPADLRRAA